MARRQGARRSSLDKPAGTLSSISGKVGGKANLSGRGKKIFKGSAPQAQKKKPPFQQNPEINPARIQSQQAQLPQQDFNPEISEARRQSQQAQLPQKPLRTPDQIRLLGAGEEARRPPLSERFGDAVINAIKRDLSIAFNGTDPNNPDAIILAPAVPGMSKAGTLAGVVKKGARSGFKTLKKIQRALVKNITPQKIKNSVINSRRKRGVSLNSPINSRALFWTATLVWGTAGLIKDGLDTRSIGTRDIQEEAGGYARMLLRDLDRMGDEEAVADMEALIAEIDVTQASFLPLSIGAAINSKKYVDLTNRAWDIFKVANQARREVVAEGGDPNDFVANTIKAEQIRTAEADKRNAAHAETRLMVEQKIIEMKEESRRAGDAASRKNAEDMAQFWLEYQKQLLLLQEQEREEQAAFWLEYRKQIMKLQQENQRSNLNFGGLF